MTMRYLLVRYVSDLARNEPKNVGVLLASQNSVLARFLGEKEGKVDARSVRSVVSHSGTYKQWIEYWRHVISEDSEPNRTLDQVLQSSNGNYVASEGEMIYLPAEIAANPYATLDHLYYRLVSEFPKEDEEAAERTLNDRCEEIIKKFDLRKNQHFKEGPIVDVTVTGSLVQRIIPSFSWVNGREIYFQKVSLLAIRPEASQRNVNNAAWIFERLKQDKSDRITKALVKVTDSTPEEDQPAPALNPREQLAVLNRLADEVIDVDDYSSVEQVFAPLAAAV